MNPNTSLGGMPASVTDIDALLGDLEVEEIAATDAITEVEADAETDTGDAVGAEVIDIEEPGSTDMSADDEAALTAAVAKDETYAEAETSSDVDTDAADKAKDVAAAAAASPKPARTRAASTGTRTVRSVSDLPEDAFVLTTDIPDDLAKNKADVIALRPNQVKIAEKFDNILSAVAAGKTPSTYVMDCFALLDKAKEITSKDLVAGLRQPGMRTPTEGYTEGTARSQVGQVMALFGLLQIATRTGDKLVLNDKSTLAVALRDLQTAAAV